MLLTIPQDVTPNCRGKIMTLIPMPTVTGNPVINQLSLINCHGKINQLSWENVMHLIPHHPSSLSFSVLVSPEPSFYTTSKKGLTSLYQVFHK